MKILLVTPPPNPGSLGMENFFLLEPLAIEYIAAGVQGKHEVKIVDCRVPSEPELHRVLEDFRPDVIGAGGFTIDVLTIHEMMAEAKRVLPGILTVVGGQHATMMPEDFFVEAIDVVVKGEGVFTFQKICDYHQSDTGFETIPNIYYKKEGNMVFTEEVEHPPLESLPFPARHLTAHVREKYVYPLMFEPGKMTRIASIRGTAGCIYNCNFCSISKLYKRKVYRRPIQQIVEELLIIEEPVVYFVDDEFLLDPERAIALARAIGDAGIKKTFWVFGRVDNIVKNPECIEELAKIGLKVILIGLESHDERYLKRMRKGSALTNNQKALRVCHENNVQVRGNFIVYPDFEKKDFRALARYSKKLNVDLPGFSILTPLPGTDLYDSVKDQLISDNYNFFDVGHTLLTPKLPLKQFYKEFSKLFMRGTSIKRKIELYRQVHPELRDAYFKNAKKMAKRVKKLYLEY
jgi:radical SAM superfamily enzyme YgiQ (UPF0313 family)